MKTNKRKCSQNIGMLDFVYDKSFYGEEKYAKNIIVYDPSFQIK